jgi:signal transduction histidine kinase/CheY-like chemotaxis protein
MNPAAASLLNRMPEECLGRPLDLLMAHTDHSAIDIVRANGSSGTGELRTNTIEWNGKKATLVSVRDVTERIVFDRLKDDFISNVSHELRTPLTAIREAVCLLRDGILGEINEKQRNFLAMCLRNADHLQRIVDTLLDISKIEAGKVKLDKHRSDLCDIARSVVEAFTPVAQKKGLSLAFEAPGGPAVVFADRDRMVQVLNNLVGNAIKFTERGSINVSLIEADSRWVCSISDTGRGIAEEDIPQVFNKFQQFGATAGAENKGTGLGLAISKEIVQLHAGDIAVQSELDHGSTFTFSLPAYHTDFELLEPIQHRLADSTEPFLLFAVRLTDPAAVNDPLGEHPLQKLTTQMSHTIKSVAKPVGTVTLDPDQFYFMVEAPHDAEPRLQRRMLRAVKEAFFELGIDSEPLFSYGVSRFPQDGDSPERLLETCRNGMRDERAERLAKRILIVDDEKALTEATRDLLNLLGYTNIDTANNGEAAFEKLKTFIPDLMILDMKMPGMSGYEVIGRLKENHTTKDVPILIMSGFDVETGRFLEYIGKKAILTLNKPADPDIFRKTVYYLM